MTELTHKVLVFQKNRTRWEELQETLALHIYRFPQENLGWDEDQSAELFLFCYKKMQPLVLRFCYQGLPFELYLRRNLQWRALTLQRQRNRTRIREQTLKEPTFWYRNEPYQNPAPQEETELPDLPAPLNRLLPRNHEGCLKSQAMQQRLLILCLKYPLHLRSRHCPQIARLTDTPLEIISHSLTNIRNTLTFRLDRVRELEIKRNDYYFKIHRLEKRLREAPPPCRAPRDREKLTEYRRRLNRLNQTINAISLTPTHNDIAQILRIPKGTVDSALYYMRHLQSGFPRRHRE